MKDEPIGTIKVWVGGEPPAGWRVVEELAGQFVAGAPYKALVFIERIA